MNLIWWGVALLIIGVIFAAVGVGLGGAIQYIGWILLIVGVVLALIHVLGNASRRREVH